MNISDFAICVDLPHNVEAKAQRNARELEEMQLHVSAGDSIGFDDWLRLGRQYSFFKSWFQHLPPVPDSVKDELDSVLDSAISQLKRSHSPSIHRQIEPKLITDVEDKINLLIASGQGFQPLQLWLDGLRHGDLLDFSAALSTDDDVTRALEGDFAALVSRRTNFALPTTSIHLSDSLGPILAGIALSGGGRKYLILGKDSFLTDDMREAQFRLFRLLQHSLYLPTHDPGFWFDFKLDVSSDLILPVLLDARLRSREAENSNLAARLMYDFYAESHNWGKNLRKMLDQPDPIEAKGSVYASFYRRYIQVPPEPVTLSDIDPMIWGFRRSLGNLLRRRPRFGNNVKIVREHVWSPVYIAWQEPGGKRLKRWIPCRLALYALGLNATDVSSISKDELDSYTYAGILIDPEDIAAFRSRLSPDHNSVSDHTSSTNNLQVPLRRRRRPIAA